MATLEKVAASTNGERELSINRLTDIDGIARKTAEAMYETGIRGYADLDQYLRRRTAEQVSAALKEHGVNRPPAFIDRETWARQARELGELESTVPMPFEGETEPSTEPEDAPSNRTAPEHDAGFAVSFDIVTDGDREPVLRTTVRDGTNGDQKKVFQGSDAEPWVNWILERANLPVALADTATQAEMAGEQPHSETEAAASPIPVKLCDARLEIGDVQLSVLGSTAGSPEKRLQAEVSFKLSGAGAEALASKSIPFWIEGYTVEIESGASELVASDRGRLTPQVFEYKGRQEFSIPDLGRYEFHIVVLLLPPGEMAAFHQGPTLKVVP